MNSVIAFDVSMGKSYMVVYTDEKTCRYEGEILHNRTHFQNIYNLIKSLIVENGQAPSIVFEATGVYSRQLERFMNDHGFQYCLLNPLEAKIQTASMRTHKTDKSDAHRLAQTHFKLERKTKREEQSDYQQLRALSRYYAELDEEMKLIRIRIHNLLQLSFPELEMLFTQKSMLFFNILQLFPHPDFLLNQSKTVIRNRIMSNTGKNIGAEKAKEKAVQLIAAAKESYPAISSDDVRCQHLITYANRYLEVLAIREKIVQQMVELSDEKAAFHILKSIPGIGDNTAVRILAEMGSLERFNNHKQLNAYAGIDIRRFQSGTLLYKDKINKRGNSHLRKILYFTIQNMLCQRRLGGNHIVEYYDKLKTQPYSKCHKVASIACVNKLLKCIFHLITHDKYYDYQLTPGRNT